MRYFLLFLLPFSLYASKILSYNIYERTDRDDVMITFDTPYSGIIRQSISKSKIIIKLENTSIESSKTKKVNSKFLRSLYINPMKGQTQIIASVLSGTQLVVSKTSDSYGLRLRFLSLVNSNKTPVSSKRTTSLNKISKLPTKKEIQISTNYYLVVGFLIIAIIVLLIFKKRLQIPLKSQKKESWLFKSSTTPVKNVKEASLSDPISIRFQKAIDNTNSVVMLDFGSQSYLVLMGNNNILLDKFNEDRPGSQEEFESVLQSRHEELEQFLNNNETPSVSHKEPLQAYKERAASLIYSDEI